MKLKQIMTIGLSTAMILSAVPAETLYLRQMSKLRRRILQMRNLTLQQNPQKQGQQHLRRLRKQ